MRSAVRCVGNFWYTAWVDAGQPNLDSLVHYKPSEEELAARRKELEAWKQRSVAVRNHEADDQ